MFEEFKPTSKSTWLEKIIKDTKGKRTLEDFNWSLDTLTLSPFYHQDDWEKPWPNLRNKSNNDWEIGTTILVKEPKIANQDALAALAAGAQALCFVFAEKPSKDQLQSTLTDIQHEWISTHLRAPYHAYPDLVEHFLKIVRAKKQTPGKVHCSFSSLPGDKMPPIKLQAYQQDLPLAAFRTISIGKSNVVEDLARALQEANQYLIQLAETNAGFNSFDPTVQFLLPLSDDYFPLVAKIRALKVLVQQLLNAWNLPAAKQNISAELDPDTMTEDENYNRIKMTSQAMAAVTAGVDRLFLSSPVEEEASTASHFSRRIALNIQHLLQQESFMNRVADPAAGSYFIDHLTKQIAEKAWSLFQQINAQS
jgi:methylmalonyl-CoA mutase